MHHVVTPVCVYPVASSLSDVPLTEPYDILVIAAHPDDAELACGGAIAQATWEGKRVAIVECTEGEMGSRGNAIARPYRKNYCGVSVFSPARRAVSAGI